MTDEVALVTEGLVALGALMGLFLRCWCNVGRIVIEVLVSLEKLLLTEGKGARVAGELF